jgi:hypothetical protein
VGYGFPPVTLYALSQITSKNSKGLFTDFSLVIAKLVANDKMNHMLNFPTFNPQLNKTAQFLILAQHLSPSPISYHYGIGYLPSLSPNLSSTCVVGKGTA